MMAALNVNSLVAHIDKLWVFMSSSEIDILVINETKLNFSVDNNEVHLQRFEIIRKDRKTNTLNGGGVCIYVRGQKPVRVETCNARSQLPNIQC